MRVRSTRKVSLVASIALLAGAAVAADSAPTVLVADFQAPAGAAWEWSRRGLSELTVEALNARGVATVDRELLSVLKSERELAAGQAQGGVRFGQLLGATYLLTGMAETTGVSRLRLSGALTRVETSEQVAAFSTEGEYKLELQALVNRWVGGLSKGLSCAGRDAAAEAPENPVKPEALMFFQSGVDACAQGRPAMAVGFFRSAYDMDPRLGVARDWEIRAYELGGLPDYAAALRNQYSGQAKGGLAPAPAPAPALRGVVRVLPPVWLGGAHAPPPGMPQPAALRTVIEEAALAVPGVRLYRPESLAHTLAEQDRQLSLDFDMRTTARYARWLVPDAMLFCTLARRADGSVQAEIGLMDAVSAQIRTRRSVAAPPQRLPIEVAGLVRQALTDGQLAAGAPSPLASPALSGPLTREDIQLLPDHRSLAAALDVRMRGQRVITQGQLLAVFYANTGLPELVAKELGLLLELAESPETGTPEAVASLYGWFAGIPYDSEPSTGRKPFFALTENAVISNALGASGCGRFTGLRQRVVGDPTPRPSTFALLYMEAFQAYQESNWQACLAGARSARDLFERCVHANVRGEPLFEPYLNDDDANADLIRINCLFLEGAALRRLGQAALARPCFDEIQRLEGRGRTFKAFNFLVPAFAFDNKTLRVQFCQFNRTDYLRQLIRDERSALDEESFRQAALAKLEQERADLAAQVRRLQAAPVETTGGYLVWLREVAEVWDTLAPATNDYCLLSERVSEPPECDVSACPKKERVALAFALTCAYLRATGVDPDELSRLRDVSRAVPRLRRIASFYKAMRLGAECVQWTKRLLGQPVDVAFEHEVLCQQADRLADQVRLPAASSYRPAEFLTVTNLGWRARVMGFRGIKNNTISILNAMADDINDYQDDNDARLEEQKFHSGNGADAREEAAQDIAQLADLFEDRQDRPALANPEARLWRRLSRRALMRAEYPIWFQASCRAQRCGSSGWPPEEDQFIVRLALSSATQDVLQAAIRLREEAGATANPVPPPAWYSAALLCIQEGAYQEALLALRTFREIYDTYEVTTESYSLYADDSDASIRWSVLYLEGLAMEKIGEKAEAAVRFRALSQRFGTRGANLYTEVGRGGGYRNAKPLGLLASEVLQGLHGTGADSSCEN